DLAAPNSDIAAPVRVRLGRGAGGFTAVRDVAIGTTPNGVAVGDFNGDGRQDLAVANYGGTVSIRLGNGAGGFPAAPDLAVGRFPVSVAVAGFNGDRPPPLPAPPSPPTPPRTPPRHPPPPLPP